MENNVQSLASLAEALLSLTQDRRLLRQQVAENAPVAVRALVPYQLSGHEAVCDGFSYTLQVLHCGADLPLKELLGLPMAVSIADGQGGQRLISGIVCRPEVLICDGSATLMQLELRDALSLLRLRKNRRIFRDQSVVSVIRQILDEHLQANPVLSAAFGYDAGHLSKDYPERALMHQAGESDAAFIERLMRQEGIAWCYRFSINNGQPFHTLVLSDDPRTFEVSPAGTVRFHRADATEEADTVVAWQAWREMAPGATQRDQFDYKTVQVDQALELAVLAQGAQGDALAGTLTDYHYDAALLAAHSQHQAQMNRSRIQAHEFAAKGFRGESVVRQFVCGTSFTLSQHPEVDRHPVEERSFTLTRLRVYARNNVHLDDRVGRSLFQGWQYDAPHHVAFGEARADNLSDAPMYYNRFECVRRQVPIVPAFDPERDVPRLCAMSALVANENGEELDVDEQGRICVRFLFAHQEPRPQAQGAAPQLYDSARVRVVQPFAAEGFGTTLWPRNGTEVILHFLDGHPDKPIVWGSPYNGNQPSARYAGKASTPANAALAGIRTKEINGQRHSHLRFSDFTGQIGTQIATDHAATQLSQGWLGTPHDQGQSTPRGEGFELTTDASGAIRSAQALLISAFGRLQAGGKQLDRQETLALMQECMNLFLQLGEYAAGHAGLALDTQAHNAQHTQLEHWDNGSNLRPDAAGGGAAIVAITAPEGLHNSTPASVLTHAGQNIDSVAVGHLQHTSGGHTIVNAGQGVSTFAQSGGIRTIAHQGELLLQSQHDSTRIDSAVDCAIAAQGKITLDAPEIILRTNGASIRLSDMLTLMSRGAIASHAASFPHTGPDSLAAQLPAFSADGADRLGVLRYGSGPDAPVAANSPYRARLSDGSVIQGLTDAQGQVPHLARDAMHLVEIELIDKAKS